MIKNILRTVFRGLNKLQAWVEEDNKSEGHIFNQARTKNNQLIVKNENMTQTIEMRTPRFKVVNVWEHLTFKEGTQAHHITKVLDFEEWTPMDEILRRVNELFGILYQNERSLYPYLKTLVDSGLLEANMTGGKMRWKKRNLLITVNELIEEEVNVPVAQSQTLQ